MSVDYEVIGEFRTDVGCQRRTNEDSNSFLKPKDRETRARKGILAIVADGMGGHAGGKMASRLAVETIGRAYYAGAKNESTALVDAMQAANQRIYTTARLDERFAGMGTTCTALLICDDRAHVAHVGDSRLYLIREREIYLMSEDHSVVMNLYRQGLVSLESVRCHHERNVILRALGSRPKVEVTTWSKPFPVCAGDRFILCSDGLSDLVTDDEICAAALTDKPASACESLVELARERGGSDNITVGLVSIQPRPAPSA